MAQTIGNSLVKLNDGKIVQAQQGGWYDGRQYWGGTLSEAGVINSQSNQIGAGQAVSSEVNAQSATAQGKTPQEFESYLQSQRQQVKAQTPTPSSVPTGGTGTTGATNVVPTSTPTLNLNQIYTDLQTSSGIKTLEEEMSQKEKKFIDAKGKINDNPWLSEATRVGREAKLTKLFDERTANLRGDIATKKADIETQLNLQTKQFDINSEVARQGLERLNTLLSMGALSGATGEDIANLTRTTGISSDMILAAVNTAKQKDVKTQVITSTNDAGVVTATVINQDTGEIIKQSSLGSIGNKEQGSATSESEKLAYYKSSLREDIETGIGVKDIYKIYSGILDPNDIIYMYNANSPNGPAKESSEELAKYGVSLPKSSAYSGF